MKAQNDARFSEVLSGIDKINANLSAHGEIVKSRLEYLDADVKSARSSADEASSAAKSVKWNIFFTGLTVAALAYGGFALWNQAIEMTTGILGSEQPNADFETSPKGQD